MLQSNHEPHTMFLLNWLLRRRYSGRADGTVTKRSEITSLLTLAQTQQSRVELVFDRNERQRHTVTCILAETTADSLVLELPGFLTISRAWRGKRVDCSFTVTVQKKNTAHFGFTATVVDLKPCGNVPCIILSLPGTMELRQKRLHLRIKPPARDIQGLTVWPAPWGRHFHAHFLEAILKTPGVSSVPHQHGPVQLLDLSAGGARIELDVQSSPSLFPKQIKYLLLRLELAQEKNITIYHLLARVENVVHHSDAGTLELGMEFQMLSQKDAPDSRWKRIDPRKGIDTLGNWVFQRHLDLYREKGLT